MWPLSLRGVSGRREPAPPALGLVSTKGSMRLEPQLRALGTDLAGKCVVLAYVMFLKT